MRLRPISLALLLTLATMGLPLIGATGPGSVEVGVQVGPAEDIVDPSDASADNGPNEPGNNDCGGGLTFAGLTRGTHDDKFGPTDPGDWFDIELFRTESLVAGAGGAGAVTYADSCGIEPLPVSPALVSRNGFYPLRVQGAGGYKLTWEITPNDARIAGYDIGDTAANAFSVNALPSYAPQVPVIGSLPARPDQILGRDQDWFRLNTPLPEAPASGETNVAFGLLTAKLSDGDCNGSTLGLQLYGPDSVSRVGDPQPGCEVTSSCITLGLSTVYAQASILTGPGTGYSFVASTSPLYFVWLNPDNSIGTGDLNARDPWCDPLVPAVLSLLPTGNALVDRAGNIVARLPKAEVGIIP